MLENRLLLKEYAAVFMKQRESTVSGLMKCSNQCTNVVVIRYYKIKRRGR
nr:MAG TPA: hypothetical protein [Siphoviridae sp. ctHdl3]